MDYQTKISPSLTYLKAKIFIHEFIIYLCANFKECDLWLLQSTCHFHHQNFIGKNLTCKGVPINVNMKYKVADTITIIM